MPAQRSPLISPQTDSQTVQLAERRAIVNDGTRVRKSHAPYQFAGSVFILISRSSSRGIAQLVNTQPTKNLSSDDTAQAACTDFTGTIMHIIRE